MRPPIAKARHILQADVSALVDSHIEGRLFGQMGEPHVKVVKLYLAPDTRNKS